MTGLTVCCAYGNMAGRMSPGSNDPQAQTQTNSSASWRTTPDSLLQSAKPTNARPGWNSATSVSRGDNRATTFWPMSVASPISTVIKHANGIAIISVSLCKHHTTAPMRGSSRNVFGTTVDTQPSPEQWTECGHPGSFQSSVSCTATGTRHHCRATTYSTCRICPLRRPIQHQLSHWLRPLRSHLQRPFSPDSGKDTIRPHMYYPQKQVTVRCGTSSAALKSSPGARATPCTSHRRKTNSNSTWTQVTAMQQSTTNLFQR
jgi:hypothetical protein